ncbi:Crp/Fnr family transcriptional regulator [Chryseobacterium shandongense]|uniref:Crp/Fnr family transcriptional regulator n=1 Tax=Chryseobacterium shandongense TaxID=1493872 RepID=A0AAD0YA67_9FLAO|nr:Crp/Fnr family transcriptional regulator [Chryseobacterium shandongense]AZA85492.1 Crp/Fnr family transcriptional regulator [Chryseobacterium shandongense]AZA97664.1 Crp/Fnr family transcriptional regulator [Chryseobacterium shandongense]
MYESFFNYLKKFSSEPLTEDDKVIFARGFKAYKLRKRQYFLQAGDVCANFAFITRGAMRRYTVDDRSTEHIDMLAVEDWWMGDRESFAVGTPSIYHIDACEDTEMLLLSRSESIKFRSIPVWCEMLYQLDLNNNIASQQRIVASVSLSAENRYLDFITRYPEFESRFPQHLIASYLGITKDTLSRIKRKILYK